MSKVDKAKVRELMAKRGILTFKELSTSMKLSRTQISNILSDKFEPIKSNIVELANFLEVSPISLIKESHFDSYNKENEKPTFNTKK